MVIEIEDINDNAPQFIYSDSVFGEFISETASTFYLKLCFSSFWPFKKDSWMGLLYLMPLGT